MELHLPYLVLREHQNFSAAVNGGEIRHHKNSWEDLNFLGQHICRRDLLGRSIYAAHATIVVSGWDYTKYTAWSFVEPGPVVRQTEQEQDDWSDQDEEADDSDSKLLPEDVEHKFATYGWQHFIRVRDLSWDPRVYFLRAVQIKITVALQEYEYLIDHLSRIEELV